MALQAHVSVSQNLYLLALVKCSIPTLKYQKRKKGNREIDCVLSTNVLTSPCRLRLRFNVNVLITLLTLN